MRPALFLLVCLIAGCVYDPFGPYCGARVCWRHCYHRRSTVLGSPMAWRLVALASGAVSRILALAPSPAVGWIVKRINQPTWPQ